MQTEDIEESWVGLTFNASYFSIQHADGSFPANDIGFTVEPSASAACYKIVRDTGMLEPVGCDGHYVMICQVDTGMKLVIKLFNRGN